MTSRSGISSSPYPRNTTTIGSNLDQQEDHESSANLNLKKRKEKKRQRFTAREREQHQHVEEEELHDVHHHSGQGDLQGAEVRVYRENVDEFQGAGRE